MTKQPKTEPIITARHLVKSYGNKKAVNDISFEVFPGEIFGLLGPNGAGKTTTMEMLESLRSIDSGHAEVAGIDVAKDPKAVKKVIGIQLPTQPTRTAKDVRQFIWRIN